MANGDAVRAGQWVAGKNTTTVAGDGAKGNPFLDTVVFSAQAPLTAITSVDGVLGVGANSGSGFVSEGPQGGNGVIGLGAPRSGTGVFGAGSFDGGGGTGVFGVGGINWDALTSGPGIVGWGRVAINDNSPPGILGFSDGGDGVTGLSQVGGRSGVYGWNGTKGRGGAFGVYGRCNSIEGTGVAGSNDAEQGNGVGVSGRSNHIGVLGIGPTAGYFLGDVTITGSLTVAGVGHKSAAVPFGDGTLRRLYCVESPESWFEDFGEGTLTRGKATIKIAPDFVRCIRRGLFHVFLTPLGDCKGLFVKRRTSSSFEVRELGGGRGNLKFSYRLVAKRKDTNARRLEKVSLPRTPTTAISDKKGAAVRTSQYETLRSEALTSASECLRRAATSSKPPRRRGTKKV